MKNIFKKNQIIIAALAVMICIAGYLNFTKEDTEETDSSVLMGATDDIFDDADLNDELVSLPDNSFELSAGGELINADNSENVNNTDTITTLNENESEGAIGEAVLASLTINSNYFSEAKISREQMRAKNKETLMSIIENGEINEEQKQEALQSMIAMTHTAELETATEILLQAKGFDGVVVSIIEDSIDVIVNALSITDSQVAQIEDIVTRKTGCSPDDIRISHVVTEE